MKNDIIDFLATNERPVRNITVYLTFLRKNKAILIFVNICIEPTNQVDFYLAIMGYKNTSIKSKFIS